jgi:hypothetical protein
MYDGGSISSPVIGEYCDSTPPYITTTSNEIFIHYLTNPSGTDLGFKLMYNPTSNQHLLQLGATQSFERLRMVFKRIKFLT